MEDCHQCMPTNIIKKIKTTSKLHSNCWMSARTASNLRQSLCQYSTTVFRLPGTNSSRAFTTRAHPRTTLELVNTELCPCSSFAEKEAYFQRQERTSRVYKQRKLKAIRVPPKNSTKVAYTASSECVAGGPKMQSVRLACELNCPYSLHLSTEGWPGWVVLDESKIQDYTHVEIFVPVATSLDAE